MNKYILGDMVAKRLTREIGMIASPLPEEIKTLEIVLPSGRLCFDSALYQAEKIKRISIINHTHGENGGGTIVMMFADDKYDLPLTFVDIAFNFGRIGKIFTQFEAMLLINDEESIKKYVDPFRKWREAIEQLPSEPVTEFSQSGGIWKTNISPTNYLRYVPTHCLDEIVQFIEQFLDIFLDIYRKAEPIKNVERKKVIDAFRLEWNKKFIDDDPAGVMITEAFGRKTAQLFYEYLNYL
jgi:hypothetical protein